MTVQHGKLGVNEASVVYVYGAVFSSDRPAPGLAGIANNPVRHVSCSGVAAIVSDVRRGPIGRAKDIRTHWRVLGDTAQRSTVVPLPFGTIMDSDRAVRDDFVAPNKVRLAAQLAGLDGKVQLNVRGLYREETLLRAVARRSPLVAGRPYRRAEPLPTLTAYYDMLVLDGLIEAETDRRRERDVEIVMTYLDGLAVESQPERRLTREAAVNVAFLVERDRVDRFSAAVEELRALVSDRMSLRCIGPLPAYSFARDRAETRNRAG